jgi:hypothetical protein
MAFASGRDRRGWFYATSWFRARFQRNVSELPETRNVPPSSVVNRMFSTFAGQRTTPFCAGDRSDIRRMNLCEAGMQPATAVAVATRTGKRGCGYLNGAAARWLRRRLSGMARDSVTDGNGHPLSYPE